MDTILPMLPTELRRIVENVPAPFRQAAEEIRIRERRPLEIIANGEYRFVTADGGLVRSPEPAYRPSRDDCAKLLDMLTDHSLYTFEEQLKRGYITIAGGHRVGLAGKTVVENGRVKLIRDISGFNIRIAKQVVGIGRSVVPALWDESSGNVHHTLVVSPPQRGKTTLIRDLARLLSSGGWDGGPHVRAGLKVGIVDERSEIAACVKGVPTFDVGPRTDVLDGCPKAEGMMMLIRSMSPDVVVVDEIGRPEDAEAVREALHAGVRVIATAHGRNIDDVGRRPAMRELLAEPIFDRFVVLAGGRAGTRCEVYDNRGRPVGKPTTVRENGRAIC